MSGHSHFKTIKARKEAVDAKKGKIFSKFARLITIAAKEGGGDPVANVKLKGAIEQARQFNMPKDNIDRAIKKGTGELAGESLEQVSFEGFGPENVALIIEGITDNKNRTLSEIKTILGKFGCKMAGEGAVKWMFEQKGIIVLEKENKNRENVELAVIDAGAEDFEWGEDFLTVYTEPNGLDKVKSRLEERGLKVDSFSLGWKPKEEIEVENKEKVERLFEALDDNDSVQEIYSNLKS